MEIDLIRRSLDIINPWIESIVLFFVYIFIVMILAKLISEVTNRLLNYFEVKNEYFPEAFEYLTYLVGLIIMLTYFGVFRLAIILVLGFVALLIFLAIIFSLYNLIPELLAGRKVTDEIIKKSSFPKKYKKSALHVTFKISEYENLVVKNSHLLNNLNR